LLLSPRIKQFCSVIRIEQRLAAAAQISGWKARAASIRVHSWFKTNPNIHPAIIRENPYQSVAKKTSVALHPGTPVRGSPAELRTCAFPFATSHETNSKQCSEAAQFRQHRSRAGKPELHRFVSIRGSKRTRTKHRQHRSRAGKPQLHQFVPIRGHSWFKTNPHEAPAAQISGWKARAASIRAHSWPFVVQKRTRTKHRQHRSRAGKPQLHQFVPIRVHSWFKTTPTGRKKRGISSNHSKCPSAVHWDRQDSNLQPRDYASHFGFRRPFQVRGLDHPFTPHAQDEHLPCLPSGLYTFRHQNKGPGNHHCFSRGLARDWHTV